MLQLVRTLNALLNAILQEQADRGRGARTATRSIKSYVQLGKLALARSVPSSSWRCWWTARR